MEVTHDYLEKGGKPIQMKATELVLKSHKKSLYSDRTELTRS